jgi:hypothetical protein
MVGIYMNKDNSFICFACDWVIDVNTFDDIIEDSKIAAHEFGLALSVGNVWQSLDGLWMLTFELATLEEEQIRQFSHLSKLRLDAWYRIECSFKEPVKSIPVSMLMLNKFSKTLEYYGTINKLKKQ